MLLDRSFSVKKMGRMYCYYFPAFFKAVAVCTVLFSLAACGPAGSAEGSFSGGAADRQSMQVRELPLTDETRQLLSLIDTHSSSRIFEYTMDEDMKELHFFVEEFKDGRLTCLTGAGGPAPVSGRFAVMFDPDGITLSWEGGKYSLPLDTTAGFRSSVTSQLSGLSSIPYNEKEAVAMIANSQTNSIESAAVNMYRDLIGLKERHYDRVLFVTAAFTDFTVEDELVSYNGIVRDKAALPADTVRWLEGYNGMDVEERLSFSYAPLEFMNLTGKDVRALETEKMGTVPSPAKESPMEKTEGRDISGPAPEEWLLMTDGRLYRGTAETGPMGDSGCVAGQILSLADSGQVPGQDGQANFGEIGSPYTRDSGDGMIMVLVNDEWYVFYRESES